MLNFFEAGGVAMYAMAVTALLAVGFAIKSGPDRRGAALATGAGFVAAEGLAGVGLGLTMVSRHVGSGPEALARLTLGVGEASNNAVLGGGLALALMLAAVLSADREP